MGKGWSSSSPRARAFTDSISDIDDNDDGDGKMLSALDDSALSPLRMRTPRLLRQPRCRSRRQTPAHSGKHAGVTTEKSSGTEKHAWCLVRRNSVHSLCDACPTNVCIFCSCDMSTLYVPSVGVRGSKAVGWRGRGNGALNDERKPRQQVLR